MQFARLGAVYAEDVLGRTNPGVGLLSIGEEPEKGNAVVEGGAPAARRRRASIHRQRRRTRPPAGGTRSRPVDVVVCDGFVGNVVLKFYEAVAPFMIGTAREGAASTTSSIGQALKHLDYSEYGGAPLLGVQGRQHHLPRQVVAARDQERA